MEMVGFCHDKIYNVLCTVFMYENKYVPELLSIIRLSTMKQSRPK